MIIYLIKSVTKQKIVLTMLDSSNNAGISANGKLYGISHTNIALTHTEFNEYSPRLKIYNYNVFGTKPLRRAKQQDISVCNVIALSDRICDIVSNKTNIDLQFIKNNIIYTAKIYKTGLVVIKEEKNVLCKH